MCAAVWEESRVPPAQTVRVSGAGSAASCGVVPAASPVVPMRSPSNMLAGCVGYQGLCLGFEGGTSGASRKPWSVRLRRTRPCAHRRIVACNALPAAEYCGIPLPLLRVLGVAGNGAHPLASRGIRRHRAVQVCLLAPTRSSWW